MNLPTEEVFEVDNVGCGCVLMHRDVFEPVYKKYHGFPCEMRMLWYYIKD